MNYPQHFTSKNQSIPVHPGISTAKFYNLLTIPAFSDWAWLLVGRAEMKQDSRSPYVF